MLMQPDLPGFPVAIWIGWLISPRATSSSEKTRGRSGRPPAFTPPKVEHITRAEIAVRPQSPAADCINAARLFAKPGYARSLCDYSFSSRVEGLPKSSKGRAIVEYLYLHWR